MQPRKTSMPRSPRLPAIQVALSVLGIVAALWLAHELISLVALVLASLVLATGIHPLVRWLQSHSLPRGPAIFAVLLAIAFLAGGIFWFIGASLWSESNQAWSHFQEYTDSLTAWLQQLHERLPQLPNAEGVLTSIQEQLSRIGDYLLQTCRRRSKTGFLAGAKPDRYSEAVMG